MPMRFIGLGVCPEGAWDPGDVSTEGQWVLRLGRCPDSYPQCV
jgi:hypothetical protein